MNHGKVSRVFYFGPVNTSAYVRYTGQDLLVGAVANKVLSITSALQSVGVTAKIVSHASLAGLTRILSFPPVTLTESGVEIDYLGTRTSGIKARLLASWRYFSYARKNLKSTDVVILYNFFPEYFLVSCYLAIKGIRVFIDVEDAPSDGAGVREMVSKLSLKLLRLVCSKRYITAAAGIDRRLGLKLSCNVYGAVKTFSSTSRIFEGDEVRLIFGGTLDYSTGLDLVCGAVDEYSKKYESSAVRKLNIIFTGFGGEAEIELLGKRNRGLNILITRAPRLTREAYVDLLRVSHGAFSLKLSGGVYGDTTFPSKVVEITSNGLLLISTKASDVPILFSEQEAIFLEEETSESLADVFHWIVENPEKCGQTARLGLERSFHLFNERAVGGRVKDFLCLAE